MHAYDYTDYWMCMKLSQYKLHDIVLYTTKISLIHHDWACQFYMVDWWGWWINDVHVHSVYTRIVIHFSETRPG